MISDKKILLSEFHAFITGTASGVIVLFLIFIFFEDRGNPYTIYLIIGFIVSVSLFFYFLKSVTLEDDGIHYNSELISWGDIESIDARKHLIINTSNGQQYKIPNNFDFFTQIVNHIRSGRPDLFNAPLITTFNENMAGRGVAFLITLGSILVLIPILPSEYLLAAYVIIGVAYILSLFANYDPMVVSISNGYLEVRPFLWKNTCRSIGEITQIEKSRNNKNEELLDITFLDGKKITVSNFVSEGQVLYDNLQALRTP